MLLDPMFADPTLDLWLLMFRSEVVPLASLFSVKTLGFAMLLLAPLLSGASFTLGRKEAELV